ncbi:kielin/chordin-like protein [Liolophura sinensis]|uniref:kielin/chordin-like protein n=1 Tax=Liolophura sinensis TaxID=3198878 RepID=UPI00315822E9
MNSILLPCLIGTLIVHVSQAAVVATAGCESEGKVYKDGDKWPVKCSAVCECVKHEEHFNIQCVSMCPPSYSPGCTKRYLSTRNEDTSTDCCPVWDCPTSCEKDGVTIPSGQMEELGTEICGCHNGELECFPMFTK